VAVAGTAPATAGTTAANALVTDAVAYAGSGSGTGLYMSLNCEFATAAANTRVSLLDGVAGIGAAGGLTVQGGLACTDPGSVNKWQAAAARTFDGFTGDSLGTSSWPSPGCPVQEAFDSWPAMFTPVAYDAAADAADNFTASNGLTGQPYILLGAPVSSAALVQSTGGMTPTGTTVHGGNPVAPGVQHATAGNGVDTENGDFSLSATDLSIPGFGPALDFTRTYDAQQAQQQTVAGSPGPMGYGWTDNWATSELPHRPLPGDIYTVNAVGASVLNPDDVVPDAAGDLFVADTGRSRVLEVAAADSTQFGIAMTAGHGYTVAGSPTGASGNSGIGGVATSALMSGPQSVTVDPAGNLYIADTGNNQLQEVPAATGTQWGQSMTAGHLYTIAGSTAGTAGLTGYNGPAASARLSMPVSVRLDGQGNVYIGDQGNARVLEIAATTGIKRGQSMTAGSLYVIAGSATGSSGYAGNGGPATSALMNTVGGIALDQAGNLFISESWFNVVREVPVATGRQFGHTLTANDIYTVAGDSSHAGMTGTTSGDNGPAIGSGLREPAGVALDSSGDLYIADTYNNRIQEVAAASGTQWGKSMTLGNIYTVLGQANGTSGTAGDGGPAAAAFLDLPTSVSLDSPGDLLVPDNFNSKLREVFAASSTQVFNTTPTGTGWSIIQGDGSWVNFYPKVSGTCQAPYVAYPGSGACTLPQNIGVSLNQDPTTHIFNYRPDPGTVYTYDSSGILQSIKDAAGDTLTVATGTPGSGNNCPTTAATCQVITAASGRALSVGLASNGLATTVTDPMSRRWTYAYTPAHQLAAAYDPMGHRTSFTYGAGSTGNLQLSNAMLTITTPNAQAGGPDAGDATVNTYDSLGRVTSQSDPMGNQTTINYCASASAGDCMNAATGTGFTTVTDPDGNSTVYNYSQGTLAAQTSYTGATLVSEVDQLHDTTSTGTTGGTLLVTATLDGRGSVVRNTLDSLGNAVSSIVPAVSATGRATTTMSYATQTPVTEKLPNCTASAAATVACASTSPPTPGAAGQVINPPTQVPPTGLSWTQYDTYGNDLYVETGVSQVGGGSIAETTYRLYDGNSVTLPGTSTAVTCANTAPSAELPCATVNAGGMVTQLKYDSAGDLISASAPDGNGSELSITTYSYDGDGEEISTTSPLGNLPGANVGNYTKTTAYDSDGHQTSVTQGGGAGHTVVARITTIGYDADGNAASVTDALSNITVTAYNADDEPALVTDPGGNVTLTCYDGDGNKAQTVPPAGVSANNLTGSSCPVSYPAGYGSRLAADATVNTYDAARNLTKVTSPLPAGQTGASPYETTTYSYDGAGSIIEVVAPSASTGGPNQVTRRTYNVAGELATETVGYGSTTASTISYCYDPDGNKTSIVSADGNQNGAAPCEASSPWIVSPQDYPAQATYQTVYSYDTGDKLISVARPGASSGSAPSVTSYTYDQAGDTLTVTSPNGVVKTMTYMPQGQLATVAYSNSAAHSETYAYNAAGQRLSVADASGTSTYTYDPFGELASSTNGAGQTVSYAYNDAGHTTGITYPLPASATWAATSTVTLVYDSVGMLSSVTDLGGNQMTVTRTGNGQPAIVSLGATGDTLNYAYGQDDNPSAITLKNSVGSTLQSFGYAYAPAGEILTETDTPAGASSPANYSYDARGRLTSMTPGTAATINYSYDPAGDLTALPTGANAQSGYGYNGELTSSTLASAASNYSYDADGNRLTLTKAGSTITSGTWNGKDELTAYAAPTASMTAAIYDAEGRRTAASFTATAGGTSQSNVWGDGGSLLMDSTNAYIYAGNEYSPAEQVNLATGAVTYLVNDSLGSIRGTVSGSGTLTGTASYDAWGNPQSPGGLTTTTPFGYAGGYTDPDGLLYLINRYYDPQTGQFTALDPEVDQTQAPYAYTDGNPVSETDPTGLLTDPPGPSCAAVVPSCRYVRAENFTDYMIRSAVNSVAFYDIRYADYLTSITLWDGMVKTGGPWDLKIYLGRHKNHDIDGQSPEKGEMDYYTRVTNDKQIYFNVWGNVFFGYIGMAEGFPGWLLEQASEAQGGTINSPGNKLERQMGYDMWNRWHTHYSKSEIRQEILWGLGTMNRYCDVETYPQAKMATHCANGHGW
jgi:RHS repeat-associated protein